jgi:hypothetical protein
VASGLTRIRVLWARRGAMIVRHVIQHTPVVPNDSIHRDHSHNLVTELVEKFPLQGFGEAVCDHFFGRAVLNCNFLSGNAVGDEETPNVDAACSLPARGFVVLRKFDGALVVLVKDSGDSVALGLHKIFGLKSLGQHVVEPNQFRFSGAFSV